MQRTIIGLVIAICLLIGTQGFLYVQPRVVPLVDPTSDTFKSMQNVPAVVWAFRTLDDARRGRDPVVIDPNSKCHGIADYNGWSEAYVQIHMDSGPRTGQEPWVRLATVYGFEIRSGKLHRIEKGLRELLLID